MSVTTCIRPPQGSVKLVSPNLTNRVPLEQFHQKPMGVYDGGPLKLALLYKCQLKETTIRDISLTLGDGGLMNQWGGDH